jgi:hypothetical protein
MADNSLCRFAFIIFSFRELQSHLKFALNINQIDYLFIGDS